MGLYIYPCIHRCLHVPSLCPWCCLRLQRESALSGQPLARSLVRSRAEASTVGWAFSRLEKTCSKSEFKNRNVCSASTAVGHTGGAGCSLTREGGRGGGVVVAALCLWREAPKSRYQAPKLLLFSQTPLNTAKKPKSIYNTFHGNL